MRTIYYCNDCNKYYHIDDIHFILPDYGMLCPEGHDDIDELCNEKEIVDELNMLNKQIGLNKIDREAKL